VSAMRRSGPRQRIGQQLLPHPFEQIFAICKPVHQLLMRKKEEASNMTVSLACETNQSRCSQFQTILHFRVASTSKHNTTQQTVHDPIMSLIQLFEGTCDVAAPAGNHLGHRQALAANGDGFCEIGCIGLAVYSSKVPRGRGGGG